MSNYNCIKLNTDVSVSSLNGYIIMYHKSILNLLTLRLYINNQYVIFCFNQKLCVDNFLFFNSHIMVGS